ncbi:tRNA modification GTPase TrmE [Rhinocladiella mackenziei CBS 650.93]|uniref:Rhinocladiella mackenziei CBS 650.93 unplaced genomic scaffold supercont1.10, whole genome shotgun sequence n=1 Tax=Rhinocladiella mackenziei CBS 650.93 TaxID=1442369 RepID=A0A0D2ISK8_9EURO|nr:tRNA modification GTPase TrmE [Rhinocladiella mackenziei CBS 650.93]KIW99754.1 tRNA modification GTPase TrmE [Rhinocladiella mackenziei CBS 650.93]
MICRIGFRGFAQNHVIKGASIRSPVVPYFPRGVRLRLRPGHHRTDASSAIVPDLEKWRTTSISSTVSDTIYALSTAPGRAAIAVIRISGPACLQVHRKLCPTRPLPKPRTATLRRLYNPQDSDSPHARILDRGALILYFPAPNTVTGEDILELHVHGGPAIVRSVLEAVSLCGQCGQDVGSLIRHAEPGEFTKRAFYNGRLDLTQAEALGETLAAETEQQRRLAVSGADGGLAKRYEEWRTMLLYARGELEALIDFSEDQHFDESPVEFMASAFEQVTALKRQIDIHLQNASKGELLRNGISIALLGAPNAGKSSLLNCVVGREAAIVSTEEGTTRDIVDVSVDLGGWLCRLGDMAGLRATGPAGEGQGPVGMVEQEGIRRARERARQSDVVVTLLSIEKHADGKLHVPVNGQVLDAVKECHAAGKAILLVLNKVDLVEPDDQREDVVNNLRSQINQILPTVPAKRICVVSCKDAATDVGNSDPGGIQTFLQGITGVLTDLTTASIGEDTTSMTPAEARSYWNASLSVTHRQAVHLQQCLRHLNDFLGHSHPPKPLAHESPAYHVDGQDDLVGPNTSVQNDVDIVAAAESLRFAAECLAKITGKGDGGDVEDVLGVVFEK